MKKLFRLISFLFTFVFCVSSCSSQDKVTISDSYYVGYAYKNLEYDESMDQYYIAGYKGGRHPLSVLDPQVVKAAFIDNGQTSMLIITVDCIGLDSGTIKSINKNLQGFKNDSQVDSINVISTHTHAGVDTLGLWGPAAINGKNDAFMKQIIEISKEVAYQAYQNITKGELYYSQTKTENIQEDSRAPYTYDQNIYQIRFVPNNENDGLRIVSYAAHAESLRGDNLFISADFPAQISKLIKEQTGDNFIFVPGAIGGLIKTKEFSDDAITNMQITAEKLVDYILNHEQEIKLDYEIKIAKVTFEPILENTLFMYYKFLGIINNSVYRNIFGTYTILTELSLIKLGQVTLFLAPGELFPELLLGTDGLNALASNSGINYLIPIGLANDEIGYIIPKDDFVLNSDAPYVNEAPGHYEETNSVGPTVEFYLKSAFIKALNKL